MNSCFLFSIFSSFLLYGTTLENEGGHHFHANSILPTTALKNQYSKQTIALRKHIYEDPSNLINDIKIHIIPSEALKVTVLQSTMSLAKAGPSEFDDLQSSIKMQIDKAMSDIDSTVSDVQMKVSRASKGETPAPQTQSTMMIMPNNMSPAPGGTETGEDGSAMEASVINTSPIDDTTSSSMTSSTSDSASTSSTFTTSISTTTTSSDSTSTKSSSTDSSTFSTDSISPSTTTVMPTDSATAR